MEKRVRLFLQSALILLLSGISGQVSAQPQVITEVPVNSTGFVTIGDVVYFNVGDDLWRTDGTAEGTIFLKNGILTGPIAREFNGMAMFLTANASELWRSDGTPEGTILLKTIGDESGSIVGVTSEYLFFRGYEAATGAELYRTDGSVAGTILLKDIQPGPNSGVSDAAAAAIRNQLFFAGDDGTTGDELWKTDGTPGGTVLVTEIQSGPEDGVINNEFFGFEDQVFFAGRTTESGTEPWVTDGTAEGTHLLKDVVPGSDSPTRVHYGISNIGRVYFLVYNVDDFGATELWGTNGSTSSTSRIKNVGYESKYHSFLVYQDKVSFLNFLEPYEDMWITDGTTDGTDVILTVNADGTIRYFDVVNDYILLAGTDQGYPTAFYRSDGTHAGTEAFTGFNAFHVPHDRRDITTVGDFAFYADHDGPVDEGGYPDNPADYFHLFQTDGFTTQSMRTMFDVPTVGTNNITDFKGKVIFTTHNDQPGATDDKRLWIYDPANPSQSRATFTLIDANTDEDIQTINEGDVITKSESTDINIRYNPVETPGSVVFTLNGTKVRTETAPPYSLAGDVNGDYAPWQDAQPGSYELTATPYSESGGQGTAGEALTINFTIDVTPPAGCTASGTILREYWDNVNGNTVASIPLDRAPNSTSQLTIFEVPNETDTNYGARIRGYICPPVTGIYTFWIASNDNSELWLSTDDNAANKRKIAFVSSATNPRQWDKFASQKSSTVWLSAGQRYYIEALHKQGAGTAHVAVGWQLPGGALERPIPGNRLSPVSSDGNAMPMAAIDDPDDGQTFAQPANITINATATDPDGSITKVEFFADSEKLGEDGTSPYSYVWQNAPAGSHTLTAKATDNAGAVGTSSPVTIAVTGDACSASGTISRDYWAGVSGDQVSDVPVNSAPTSTSALTIFEGPGNIGDRYATRIRGYICPPASGGYQFWIASNDASELWLSTDDDPANKVRIAWVTGATNPRQWDKFTSQASVTIMLTQGQRYYIEALHKEGIGTDHISAGWQLPNGTLERPIPGSRLSPFDMSAESMASATRSQDAATYSQIGIYPNPVRSGEPELTISGYEGIDETIETDVEIMSMTGEIVFAEKVFCGGDCGRYLMKINQELIPGVYMVNMRTNGTRHSRRLLVK